MPIAFAYNLILVDKQMHEDVVKASLPDNLEVFMKLNKDRTIFFSSKDVSRSINKFFVEPKII